MAPLFVCKLTSCIEMTESGVKLSVNDFVVRALALALKEVPEANATWGENAIRRHLSLCSELFFLK